MELQSLEGAAPSKDPTRFPGMGSRVSLCSFGEKSRENGVFQGVSRGGTCELGAEHLRVVQDVLPELLELRDPRHVLQQPHQVPADHETVHELWGKTGKILIMKQAMNCGERERNPGD